MTPARNFNWKLRDRSEIHQKYEREMGDTNSEIIGEKDRKKTIRRIIASIFLASLGVFLFLLFYDPPFPLRNTIIDQIIYQEPFQNNQVIGTQTLEKGEYRYKIYPQFSYELYGLVVSEYDSENIFDVMHRDDPAQIKDLCVVWGDNITSDIYMDLEYKSGEFTCYAKPKEGADWNTFSNKHLSNNHLIPSNEVIAKKIKRASIGDQVYVSGYLSRYEIYDPSGTLQSTRSTSVSRDDGGNGACETIYVTDFEIMKGNNYIYKIASQIAGGLSVVSFIALFLVFLFL